jgi:creatinine amidohydrolase
MKYIQISAILSMQFEEMSWKEIEKAEKDAILFLTVGPMEEHGPHLPVGTDFLIAKHVEREAMKVLEKEGVKTIALPSLPIGCCRMASDFPGSISVNWKAVRDIIYESLRAVSKMGFRYAIICNFHMDPHHIKAIYSAMDKLKKDITVCEPFSAYHYSGNLWPPIDEDGEVHADMKETSIALALFPELVKEWEKLPPVKIKMDGPDALFKTMKEMGAEQGYVGSPSLAYEEYGKEFMEKLVEICVKTARSLIEGEMLPSPPKKIKILLKLIR